MTTADDRVIFSQRLFEDLWNVYRAKVPYARVYEQMVQGLGGQFVNDYVTFRTLNAAGEDMGINLIARVFLALGFEVQGAIEFPATSISARFYQHPHPDLPKVFVSQLNVEELDVPARQILTDFVQGFTNLLTDKDIDKLMELSRLSAAERNSLRRRVLYFFTDSAWARFLKEDALRRVNTQTQYGAWVMLFGNQVNHFAALVNAHGVDAIGDIEKTVAEMQSRGVPMKEEVEGERGSKLRQTATKAARVPVKVIDASGTDKDVEWACAYLEMTERGEDPYRPGQLFQGFLGPQSTRLFEMTRM